MRTRWTMRLAPLVLLAVMLLVLLGCSGEGDLTTVTEAEATGSSPTAVAGITSTTSAGSVAGVPGRIVVRLTGDQEVPPVETEATATFTLIVTTDSSGDVSTSTAGAAGLLPPGASLSYKLEVFDIEDATAAHMHLAPKGQNGKVIYPLFTGPQKYGDFSGILAEGPLNDTDLTGPYRGRTLADLMSAMLQGEAYVNIHTADDPNGALRGQIIVEPAAGTAPGPATTEGVGTTDGPANATTSEAAGY